MNEQYRRGIQLCVRKMGRYPAKMEDLDNTQSIRFHLGELLLWIGQLNKAGQELRLAYGEGKTTVLGRTSRQFLAQLPAK